MFANKKEWVLFLIIISSIAVINWLSGSIIYGLIIYFTLNVLILCLNKDQILAIAFTMIFGGLALLSINFSFLWAAAAFGWNWNKVVGWRLHHEKRKK